jgi:hypothetical protein
MNTNWNECQLLPASLSYGNSVINITVRSYGILPQIGFCLVPIKHLLQLLMWLARNVVERPLFAIFKADSTPSKLYSAYLQLSSHQLSSELQFWLSSVPQAKVQVATSAS